jgi:streptogramin lyase
MLSLNKRRATNVVKEILFLCGFVLITGMPLSKASAQENSKNNSISNSEHDSQSSADTDCGITTPCSKELIDRVTRVRGEEGAADGIGIVARFHRPQGVAVDNFGNLFIADTNNSTIRKITPSGIVSTFAGIAKNTGSADGKGSLARFNIPSAITIDAVGNLYVADSMNGTIRKITSDGMVNTIAGMPGTKGMAPDRDGKGSDARFDWPNGITVDDRGNLYFITPIKVCKITPDGVVSTLAGGVLFGDEDTKSDGHGASIKFNSLTGIAVDALHNLYVVDGGNSTIRKIDPTGYVSTMAGLAMHFGIEDGTGKLARFKNLRGITIDKIGNLYVADADSHAIRKITPDGNVSTLAGASNVYGNIDGMGASARFIEPYGLAVDAAGNVYVADAASQTIRKVTQAGVATTVAGPNGSAWFADKTVVLDAKGNLQVINAAKNSSN